MINDLFEPPPTWWEIIKEILSPMSYDTSNNDKISDKIDKNNNSPYKGNSICHPIIDVGFIT